MKFTVGSGILKSGDLDKILSFVTPNLAIVDSRSVCGIEHLHQAAALAFSSHDNRFNLSKDKSTEVLLYLTSLRQISKSLKLAGINKTTKSVGWVFFGESPPDLSEIISEDETAISIKNYDFSNLANDININLDNLTKQKIIMTRTAILPVQSR